MTETRWIRATYGRSARLPLTIVEHLDGLSWADAPNPEPNHKCWPQTRGFIRGSWTYRCACGAMSLHTPDRFVQKNANLDPNHTIYSGDYYPPKPARAPASRRNQLISFSFSLSAVAWCGGSGMANLVGAHYPLAALVDFGLALINVPFLVMSWRRLRAVVGS